MNPNSVDGKASTEIFGNEIKIFRGTSEIDDVSVTTGELDHFTLSSRENAVSF